MIDLTDATKTRFEANGTLTALGTLYHTRVPELIDPPVAVQMLIVPDSEKHAFGTKHIENCMIQFSIFHQDLGTLYTYFKALSTLFNQATSLSLGDGTYMGAQLMSRACPAPVVGTDKNNAPVYHAWTRVKFMVDRTN